MFIHVEVYQWVLIDVEVRGISVSVNSCGGQNPCGGQEVQQTVLIHVEVRGYISQC